MHFKLAKTYRYWWPVTVSVPDPDNAGQFIEQTLRLELEPLTRDEQLASEEVLAGLTSNRDFVEHEIAQILRIVRNWGDVVDDSGSVLFSEEALRAALQHTWFRTAVARAITNSQFGEAARLGN